MTDDEIISAYERLAAEEGIFCEPASASCVAGMLKAASAGERFGGQRVVCIITGAGLKDPETALRVEPQMHRVAPDIEAIDRIVSERV